MIKKIFLTTMVLLTAGLLNATPLYITNESNAVLSPDFADSYKVSFFLYFQKEGGDPCESHAVLFSLGVDENIDDVDGDYMYTDPYGGTMCLGDYLGLGCGASLTYHGMRVYDIGFTNAQISGYTGLMVTGQMSECFTPPNPVNIGPASVNWGNTTIGFDNFVVETYPYGAPGTATRVTFIHWALFDLLQFE